MFKEEQSGHLLPAQGGEEELILHVVLSPKKSLSSVQSVTKDSQKSER